jgi:HTH-type transcriptional repressor of NAD biosynthesis genes
MLANWHYLPDAVKRHFQKKVVLQGTESTGKSSLAIYLADFFNGALVTEAGRDLITDSGQFKEADLYATAKEHARRIEKMAHTLAPVIFIDTDVYTTQSYAKFRFGKYLDIDGWIYDQNHADLQLYLAADVPFVQDGTRMPEASRNDLDLCHRKTLKEFGIGYVELSGGFDERQNTAADIVKTAFQVFR